MKKLFLTLVFLASFASMFAQTDTLKIVFDVADFDYGTIEQGANGEHDFVFTNNGNVPLVLSNVTSSCGCTIPTWPKEPILPGTTGTIKVKYDTNRLGAFSKSITVFSNAFNSPTVLTIKGTVNAKTTN